MGICQLGGGIEWLIWVTLSLCWSRSRSVSSPCWGRRRRTCGRARSSGRPSTSGQRRGKGAEDDTRLLLRQPERCPDEDLPSGVGASWTSFPRAAADDWLMEQMPRPLIKLGEVIYLLTVVERFYIWDSDHGVRRKGAPLPHLWRP